MLNINQKIEEIRQKPEHVRIRYVWGSVAVCMLLIVGIWAISVNENFRSVNFSSEKLPDMKRDIQGLGKELGESISQSKEAVNSLENSIGQEQEKSAE